MWPGVEPRFCDSLEAVVWYEYDPHEKIFTVWMLYLGEDFVTK